MKPKIRIYVCGVCGRKLKNERWVYSGHTGARYCRPGDGCQKPRKRQP